MKKILFMSAILAALCACIVYAATPVTPSKNKETKSYNITNFDELKVSCVYDVEFEQTTSNSWSVEVTAPQNVLPYLKVSRRGDCLILSVDRSLSLTKGYEIKAKIKAPALTEIDMSGASSFTASKINNAGRKLEVELSGASDFTVKEIIASKVEFDASGASNVKVSALTAGEMEADASGASDIEIGNIKVDNAEIEASGASDVKLTGKAGYAEFKISGASDLHAKSFKVDNGKVRASGASDAHINITNILMQNSSGSSTIKNEK